MNLSLGDQFGSYTLISPLGEGGMGEVWKARDTRIDRIVALKVAKADFGERFEREARAVAALNHPNICTLYDVGPNYLVMEFIEGESPKGPLPLDTALGYARQIAAALEAAHEKGIVHRDLKPANIKIKPDGAVKVLDFGLAKTVEAPSGDPQSSPTLTISATRVGVILGTAAYMSPEQARGKSVDKRADIWAFGVVLYEMLTGRMLFQGEDLGETLASVMKDQPNLRGVPAEVRRLLESCLEKDPKKRLRDIGDAWRLLEDAEPAPAQGALRARRGWVAPIAAAVFALVAAAVSFVHLRETPPEVATVQTTILPPDNTTWDALGLPAISPDGRRIVFGAQTADGKTPLWVRPLDGLTAQPLAGTEGATFPFWSPDSRFLAFFADDKLKKIDASGGPVLTLADAPGARGGSWSPLGVILFTKNGGINSAMLRVSASGGAAMPVPGAMGRLPWFLPGGRYFVYEGDLEESQRANGRKVAIRVNSLDGGQAKTLLQADSNAVYAQGHLLFVRENTLMAQPFDAKRLATAGEAVPVAERVQSVLANRPAGVFSVSQTGLLAFRTSEGQGGDVLTWFDHGGKRGATVGDAANFGSDLRLSPDQKSLASGILERGGTQIWIYDLSRGVRTRLTLDAAPSVDPVWSPDGRSIAFASRRKEHVDLYRKSANGVGFEELLYAGDLDKYPTSWSPDGKFLLYYTAGGRLEIWALPLTPDQPGGPRKPFPVVQGPSINAGGQFSPDGRWIAYRSDESGRNEVYATPFPPGTGGKRLISSAGGALPRWRGDGKEIFYEAPDRQMMAAEVAVKGGALEVGQVRALFRSPGGNTAGASARAYDVTADGQRFLIPVPAEEKAPQPLTLIQNWAAGLKK
ncbi:MAG: protein kinase domain-containing protein [Bryobacteraceae bacterium]